MDGTTLAWRSPMRRTTSTPSPSCGFGSLDPRLMTSCSGRSVLGPNPGESCCFGPDGMAAANDRCDIDSDGVNRGGRRQEAGGGRREETTQHLPRRQDRGNLPCFPVSALRLRPRLPVSQGWEEGWGGGSCGAAMAWRARGRQESMNKSPARHLPPTHRGWIPVLGDRRREWPSVEDQDLWMAST